MRRRLALFQVALALALVIGPGACGSSEMMMPQEDLSIVVIQVTFNSNVPTMFQIRVNAHLGGMGDSVLTFPASSTGRAIQSGDTMALLIPTTRSGMLDLGLSGLDANGTTVAAGNGQVVIAVGSRVDVTIVLSAV
jgi:hypothetical protein